MTTRGKLIVLSGPSGSGKSTVIDRLLQKLPIDIEVCPSVTTRPPRKDDTHTKKYLHLEFDKFQEARENGELLEYAQVSGHWYGTPRQPVEDARNDGRTMLLEIDVQGGMSVKKLYPDCLMIFLKAESIDEVERRIRHRGTNSEEEINRRLEAARRELAHASEYDHQVINDDLDRAVQEIYEILIRCGGTASA
jgi:guanylate kinase